MTICRSHSISFHPKTLRALKHYARTRAASEGACGKFGLSRAVKELLDAGLKTKGFNPETLELLGQR